jgi:ribosomal protein S18 acetylase RimI-like enzyme
VGTRFFSMHDFDIVRRRVADKIPDVRVDHGIVVRRTEGGNLLVDAARVGSHPLVLSLSKVPLINTLATARRLRRFRSRLAKGHVVYVASDGRDVAGWMWLSRSRLFRDPWIGLKLHFNPDEWYLYDFWVYPGFRKSGAGALIMAETLRDLQREGQAQDVYGLIDRDNRPNQVLQRIVFGFESVQTVKYVQILVAFGRVLSRSSIPREGPCGAQPRSA